MIYRVRKGWFGCCVMQRQEADGQWVDVKYSAASDPAVAFEALPPGAHTRIAKAEKRAKAQRDARTLKAQRA